jgi:hypothetical protein
MKTVIRTVVVTVALGFSLHAADFLSLGDNAQLFLTGTAGFRADDNILLGSNKESDFIAEAIPGAELVFGNNSLTKGRLFYKETITRYGDNDDLNTELSSFGLNSKYNDEKLKMRFDAGWAQIAQNTVDVNAGFLVRRDILTVGGGSEISVTEKGSVGADINFEKTNYKRPGFLDSQITTVPVNYFFEVTPKVDASVGARFRNTSLDKGVDSKDYFYNVGFRGEFTPKLSGTIEMGYTKRDLDKGDSESAPGFESSLNYAYTEKTSIIFGLSNDFGVSGQGATQRNGTVSVGVTSKISDEWKAGASLAYRGIHYFGTTSRTDKYFEGTLSVTYVANAIVEIVGGYTYRNNDSKLAGSSFNNNVFSLAANFRF